MVVLDEIGHIGRRFSALVHFRCRITVDIGGDIFLVKRLQHGEKIRRETADVDLRLRVAPQGSDQLFYCEGQFLKIGKLLFRKIISGKKKLESPNAFFRPLGKLHERKEFFFALPPGERDDQRDRVSRRGSLFDESVKPLVEKRLVPAVLQHKGDHHLRVGLRLVFRDEYPRPVELLLFHSDAELHLLGKKSQRRKNYHGGQ